MKHYSESPEVLALLQTCQSEIGKLLGNNVKVFYREESPYLSTDDLKYIICDTCEVSWGEVSGKKRTQRVKIARQLFCYYGCMIQKRTLSSIGQLVGIDHTTVIYSRDKVKAMIDTKDSMYMPFINEVDRRINQLIPAQ